MMGIDWHLIKSIPMYSATASGGESMEFGDSESLNRWTEQKLSSGEQVTVTKRNGSVYQASLKRPNG